MAFRTRIPHKSKKTRGKCMCCSEVFPIPKHDWSKAARPRCLSCGGLLFLNGMWKGRSVNLKKMVIGGSPEHIIYPGYPSEFEIQSMIYTTLNSMGFDVRGEVNTIGNLSRFDLVLFINCKPKLIIEVKKGSKKKQEQIRRYESHKIPVVSICGINKARRFVREFFDNYPELQCQQSDWII